MAAVLKLRGEFKWVCTLLLKRRRLGLPWFSLLALKEKRSTNPLNLQPLKHKQLQPDSGESLASPLILSHSAGRLPECTSNPPGLNQHMSSHWEEAPHSRAHRFFLIFSLERKSRIQIEPCGSDVYDAEPAEGWWRVGGERSEISTDRTGFSSSLRCRQQASRPVVGSAREEFAFGGLFFRQKNCLAFRKRSCFVLKRTRSGGRPRRRTSSFVPVGTDASGFS